MADRWQDIQLEEISKIERVVAVFEISSETFPGGRAKVKILELKDGLYIGVPNMAVKDEQGFPDWTSGFGHSTEEALEDTIRSFLQTINEHHATTEDNFERATPGDFF